jgi:aspartate aminotransferase
MPDPLSINVQHLKASETVAISNEAKRRKAAGEDVLDLGVGEPDFDTPAPASQAGIQAIQKGLTRYPPNVGIAELRRGIAQQLSQMSGGRRVDPEQIVVSSGSKQSIFNACFALFGPKDRVLIPAPAWVSYPQIVHLTRAEPVLVPGDPEWGLKVSVRDLDRMSHKLTRGLILCSPCNPTGAVYTQAELKAIAEWAKKNDIWIISDEIYRRINYGPGPAPSLLDLPDELLERTVIIYGASKAYAMAALQSHTTTGANHPAQWAAAAAFSDERVDAEVSRMVAAFRRRRDYLVDRFRNEVPGIEFVEPHGAFYFFFRVDGIRERDPVTGQGFCEQLMQQEGVALVPGAAFADDRWVRLSYAVSDAELEKGLDRTLRLIRRLASARAA